MDALSKDLLSVATTVDGLDSLFETVIPGVMSVGSDDESTVDLSDNSIVLWTLQDAAGYLGLSTRTILRKLKAGSLQGRKVIGTNGPEWRITPVDMPSTVETIVRASVKTVTADGSSTQDKTIDTTVQALLKVIESQAEQLKAAADVIVYQQSQLEEKDQQIKLLTDGQYTHGWWRRFCSWALGQPTAS